MHLPSLISLLLAPEERPLDDAARLVAAERVDRAAAAGLLSDSAAGERRERLHRARTRGDLRAVTGDLAGALPSSGLVAALQVTAGLTLALTAVQFVVWALICLIGRHWTNPWWLWPAVPFAAVVAGLWLAVEGHYRPRVLAEPA